MHTPYISLIILSVFFQTGTTLEFNAPTRCVLDRATRILLVWGWHGLRWGEPDDVPAVRCWSNGFSLLTRK